MAPWHNPPFTWSTPVLSVLNASSLPLAKQSLRAGAHHLSFPRGASHDIAPMLPLPPSLSGVIKLAPTGAGKSTLDMLVLIIALLAPPYQD
jgi:hypothetical protein